MSYNMCKEYPMNAEQTSTKWSCSPEVYNNEERQVKQL